MRSRTSRNEPCPCGSGKKYKKCCLDRATTRADDEIARRLTLDLEAGTMSVQQLDGSEVTTPWTGSSRLGTAGISRVSFDVPQRQLELTLPGDQVVTVDVGVDGHGDLPPDDVPVVYLDQLHWIALAQHEWAPEKLRAEQRDAAAALIEHARAQRIIVPLSAAHMTETVPNDGRRRRHLAGTMLELSRGWVMRNPVRVRHEEIKAALEGDEPRASGVFTLRPWDIFTLDLNRTTAPADAQPGWDELFPRLTAIAAIYSSLIADEKVDLTDGLTRAAAWASSHQELAEYLRSERATREQTAGAAHARLLGDLAMEIAHAAAQSGVDPAAFSAWLTGGSQREIAGMPYLGRLEQLLVHRLRNADDKWDRNDLNDMNFLACASGYADVVVGEKKMTSYLQRADTPATSGAALHRSLSAASEHLDALLARRSARGIADQTPLDEAAA